MPVAIVVSVVVFLLGVAALCGAIAVWAFLDDRPVAHPFFPADSAAPEAPFEVTATPPARFRPPVPCDVTQTAIVMTRRMAPRRVMPPGVPRLPPPLPRAMIRGTPAPGRDDDEDGDYTEVDDGVTLIRDFRVAARR